MQCKLASASSISCCPVGNMEIIFSPKRDSGGCSKTFGHQDHWTNNRGNKDKASNKICCLNMYIFYERMTTSQTDRYCSDEDEGIARLLWCPLLCDMLWWFAKMHIDMVYLLPWLMWNAWAISGRLQYWCKLTFLVAFAFYLQTLINFAGAILYLPQKSTKKVLLQ